jgi:hypothetical protein
MGGHRETRLERGHQPTNIPGGGWETRNNRRPNGLAWGFEGAPPTVVDITDDKSHRGNDGRETGCALIEPWVDT